MPSKRSIIRKGNLRSDRLKTVPMNKRLGVQKPIFKSPTSPKFQLKNSPLRPITQNRSEISPKINRKDARFKIIAKNRTNIHDARDKLAQMAKTKDAREKLTKLRKARGAPDTSFTRTVGSNITVKTDRHGKMSLSTKKARNIPPNLGLAVQRQLGLIGSLPRENLVERSVQMKPYGGFKSKDDDVEMEEYLPVVPPIIRRTIQNDLVSELPRLPDFSYHHQDRYGSHFGVEPRPRSDYPSFNILNNKRPQLRSAPMSAYVDLDAVDDDEPISKVPLNAGIRARLDTVSAASKQSHGIFAKPKSKPLVSPGHRIVVSNLHSAVTQEDITELFADIGDLMVARLVRPGTAEVIYKNLPDANKAVEVYHNRQLDGQPMKCLLVNKRPTNNPTAPALTKSITTSPLTGITSSIVSSMRSSGAVKKPASSTVTNSDKLVPDLSTIHKVLFNRT